MDAKPYFMYLFTKLIEKSAVMSLFSAKFVARPL